MNSTIHLHPRSDVHYKRKIFHFSGVVFLAVCYHNLSRETALLILSTVSMAAVALEMVRVRIAAVNNFVLTIFGSIMREHERSSWTGLTYLVLGVLFIIAFFPVHIVNLALLFLALADPAASYFGIRFGKDKLFGRKSLQGSLAAFFVCTLTSLVYYIAHRLMLDRLMIVGILSGLAGAFAEAVPVGPLDDNLVLPVLSSAQLWIIFYVFGGF